VRTEKSPAPAQASNPASPREPRRRTQGRRSQHSHRSTTGQGTDPARARDGPNPARRTRAHARKRRRRIARAHVAVQRPVPLPAPTSRPTTRTWTTSPITPGVPVGHHRPITRVDPDMSSPTTPRPSPGCLAATRRARRRPAPAGPWSRHTGSRRCPDLVFAGGRAVSSGESPPDSGVEELICSADASSVPDHKDERRPGKKALSLMTRASTATVGYGVVRMGGGRCGTQPHRGAGPGGPDTDFAIRCVGMSVARPASCTLCNSRRARCGR
jgi:hypothetical protein